MQNLKIQNVEKQNRKITFKTKGMAASDGDGVQLTRIIGMPGFQQLDPFLMLDRFESNNPNDYIGGFPPHPHRGFETVTYLLAGRMKHLDNKGHEGVIEPGGVQWMTAGKGIIHSEMPEQENGLLKGFQLWVNLPAKAKMSLPSYQEFSPHQLAVEQRDGCSITVIAGTTSLNTQGPVINNYIKPLMLDVTLAANQTFAEPIAAKDNAFIVVVEGQVNCKTETGNTVVGVNELAVLSDGDFISLSNGDETARFLFVSASPINEPIARGGPFVMNTDAEIKQAFDDYKNGRF